MPNLAQKSIIFAKRMIQNNLNNPAAGSISFFEDDKFWISSRDVLPEDLSVYDFTIMDLIENNNTRAALEYPIHKAVYNNSNYKVIIFVKPPYSLGLTMHLSKKIFPVTDNERNNLEIPLISTKNHNLEAYAEKAANYALNHPGIIFKGYGLCTWGDNLETAYKTLSDIESFAKIKHIAR